MSSAYFQISKEARSFIFIAALSSRVAEHFLASMLADNRCARQVVQLRQDLQTDIEDLSMLPLFIWSNMAALLDLSAEVFQDKVLSAAVLSHGYIEHKVLR
eukprot:6058594-Amphidinium_carterae.1